MKWLNILFVPQIVLTTCHHSEPIEKTDPTGTYGTGISSDAIVDIATILADPERVEGQVVTIQGKVRAVCPLRGGWMDVAGADQQIRVKVPDGEIVFPQEAVGYSVTVEGTLERLELSEARAREWKAHEAAEKGEAFDPATVQGPQTIWRIRGSGAVIHSSPDGAAG